MISIQSFEIIIILSASNVSQAIFDFLGSSFMNNTTHLNGRNEHSNGFVFAVFIPLNDCHTAFNGGTWEEQF